MENENKKFKNIAKNSFANMIDKINQEQDYKGYPNEEFFPYACYFNERTILTQNGELLQVIKIPSFVKNNSSNNLFKLRKDLQLALIKYIEDDNINFWFHTVRKEVDIVPRNQKYKNNFSETLNDKWNEKNNFHKQYANEVYITIIIAENKNKSNIIGDFFKYSTFSSLKKNQRNLFNNLLKKLDKFSNILLEELKKYNPHMLKIIEKDGNYFSEHCKFFSLIINNDRDLFPLDINMLGAGLANKKISYGSNIVQVFDKERNTYLAIISLKNYNNLLLSELDRIIQINQELIISQSVSFLSKRTEFENRIKEEYNLLTTVEDQEIKDLAGYNEIIENFEDKNSKLNFVISQVLMQVKGNTIEQLEANIKSLYKVLKTIGFIAVREEMFMPTLFWSQLPANFNFVKRLRIIPVEESCQFVSLYNFPTGKLTKNRWGDAIMVLKSTINTPYFFSFHNKNDGNTLIVSPKNDYRTKLLNFLVSQASKSVEKIYYIDTMNRSNVFVNAIGGKYYELSNIEGSKKNKLIINPFELEKTKENVNFIVNWMNFLLKTDDDGFMKLGSNKTNLEEEIKSFNILLKNNMEVFKSLKDVLLLAKQAKLSEVYKVLKKWCSKDKYGFIFCDRNEKDIFDDNIIGFNLSNLLMNDELRSVILQYLLYRIYANTPKDTPTIVAVDEIWNLFDNPYMYKEFVNIIKKFSNKNIIFVATTAGSDFYENSYIKKSVDDIFTTSILLQNAKASIYQKKIFSINEQESRLLSVIKKDSDTFMIRHDRNTIFTSIKFDFLNDLENTILSADNIVVNIMHKAKEIADSENPNDWLPIMDKIISIYNKYENEKKLKEREQRQIKWQESREQLNVNQIK